MLNKLGIHSFFEIIVGPDTYSCAKPNPKPLLKTIDNLGASIKSTVFVGDTNTDYMTSKSAKVPFILLLYGHGVIHQSFCLLYTSPSPRD